MTLKVKTLIKIIIYKILEFFIKPSKAIKPKSILLIRLDGIGDYILFRNFIEVLKKVINIKVIQSHCLETLLGKI